jgi:Transposase zinc-binding domain
MALVTLQTIFQDAFSAYEQMHPLPTHVRRAARAIMPCRTAALGGHVQACPDGHMSRIWSNACRPRACPQCAYLQTERWLALQRARLLACDHSHGIFPLPHELTPLWLATVQVMPPLLWQPVRDTLGTLLADPPYLGAPPGLLAARPPWSPPLVLQPHGHGLVTGGGRPPDGQRSGRPGRGARWPCPRRCARSSWAISCTAWALRQRPRGLGGAWSALATGPGGHVSGARAAGWSAHKRAPRGLGRRPRHLPAPRPLGGGRGPQRLAAADHLGRRRLSPAVAAAGPQAAEPGRPGVRAVPSDADRGPGAEPHGARTTAGGAPGVAGLADGVCPARGRPSRAVSGLWADAGGHGGHPAGRCSSPPGLRGVRCMRAAPLGRPARGGVCLVAARGRGQRPVGSAPGRSRRQARPSRPHRWSRQSLAPTA